MDSLYPQAAYAEDQPNAQAILYIHVMRASAMTFTFFSLARIPITLIGSRVRGLPVNMSALVARTLQSSGRAFIAGSAVGAFMTWGRMRGREDIEWQDRSWRILRNKGEVKTDWVTMGGMGAGAAAGIFAARRGVLPVSIGRSALEGGAAGASVGIPFMIATYMMGRKPA
ncbi:hypothetical protein HBH56_171890 [Parastagonospora nodorum]|uniref:Uncharacterized protein n=2 Tax=Phaeosphaeria nodorum (strain SN15 / ATCC MYA-4574 / FGSC 10173) TaxID=321614 RepID=A0A7U2HWJ7_PHANO|nr:hypothetical protein SNOG_07790 [Parastagonospora nodorum SN15]KAH3908774.1 hypothetical protein HBH56_171890 [Parastagonospora nodorum]EAT85256.1 hypothetical protein SNOG_07790 [Parastagonospora nodorum SN15]KAH3928557.1 hypothetical protein HBH54_140450 [Parastagonospora nodorum]KAH3983783.1 hypothetical protein HBH52_058420 [Parastagonospora nodorum]KAH3985490.1 hypothetical protein HBH51_017320 [Parastagonospora nodorum]